jgi:hypothetical protein
LGLSDVLAALRRNIVVIVLLLAATAACATVVWHRVPLTYQSKETMIVLLPRTSVAAGMSDQPVNPYLQAGNFPTQVAASALANISNSDEFVVALRGAGVTSKTTVAVAAYGGGVVLELTAENLSSSAAPKDIRQLSAQLSTEMARRQRDAGAPTNSFITVTDLTQPSASTPVATSRTKMTGITGGIGAIVTLALTVVLDAVRSRRRSRRAVPLGAPASAAPRLNGSPMPGRPVQPVGADSPSH